MPIGAYVACSLKGFPWTFLLFLLVSSAPSTSSVNPSSISDYLFSSDSFPIVFLSICLPIAVISLFLFFFFCYYRRRATMNQSLRSNRIKSTPLHSVNNRSLHQPILPSSSSSTRTNLTNLPLRQTLLTKDYAALPWESGSFGEVNADNVRFLKEFGEGSATVSVIAADLPHGFFCSVGDYGRIFFGEFIDSKRKCLIKTLETEKGADEYLREIESKTNIDVEL